MLFSVYLFFLSFWNVGIQSTCKEWVSHSNPKFLGTPMVLNHLYCLQYRIFTVAWRMRVTWSLLHTYCANSPHTHTHTHTQVFGAAPRGCRLSELQQTALTLYFDSNFSLTLYIPFIVFQCVNKPTRCNISYEWSLLSINWLYMFRTITSPSSGASSHKLCNALVCSCYQASLAASS